MDERKLTKHELEVLQAIADGKRQSEWSGPTLETLETLRKNHYLFHTTITHKGRRALAQVTGVHVGTWSQEHETIEVWLSKDPECAALLRPSGTAWWTPAYIDGSDGVSFGGRVRFYVTYQQLQTLRNGNLKYGKYQDLPERCPKCPSADIDNLDEERCVCLACDHIWVPEPTKSEPTKPESMKPEPTKSEPTKPEPPKAEPYRGLDFHHVDAPLPSDASAGLWCVRTEKPQDEVQTKPPMWPKKETVERVTTLLETGRDSECAAVRRRKADEQARALGWRRRTDRESLERAGILGDKK